MCVPVVMRRDMTAWWTRPSTHAGLPAAFMALPNAQTTTSVSPEAQNVHSQWHSVSNSSSKMWHKPWERTPWVMTKILSGCCFFSRKWWQREKDVHSIRKWDALEIEQRWLLHCRGGGTHPLTSAGLNRKKKKKSCTEMLTGCESAQHYGI